MVRALMLEIQMNTTIKKQSLQQERAGKMQEMFNIPVGDDIERWKRFLVKYSSFFGSEYQKEEDSNERVRRKKAAFRYMTQYFGIGCEAIKSPLLDKEMFDKPPLQKWLVSSTANWLRENRTMYDHFEDTQEELLELFLQQEKELIELRLKYEKIISAVEGALPPKGAVRSLDDLGFSVRTTNLLLAEGITTEEKIIAAGENILLKIPNMGKKSLLEIRDKIPLLRQ